MSLLPHPHARRYITFRNSRSYNFMLEINFHSDHTSGLSSSWPHPIHCTAVTGKLLIKKFKIDPKFVVSI